MVQVKTITMRKASGFNYSLTASIVETPAGKIRTIEIKDHEILMADQEPSDTMIIIYNEKDIDTIKRVL
jgi:hypothetical protein